MKGGESVTRETPIHLNRPSGSNCHHHWHCVEDGYSIHEECCRCDSVRFPVGGTTGAEMWNCPERRDC